MKLAKRNTVALALGGGGARGYAHIGAIRELESRGFEIVAISGTSMGAVIGALYAAGKLNEFEKWAKALTRLDVVGLMDFGIGKAGAINAERIFKVIYGLLGDSLIEDLPIPFTAVASDLLTNKEVLFQAGPLVPALRASVSIPGVITPVLIDGKLLADGGIVNPVPVSPLKNARARRLIAVDLAHGRLVDPFKKELSSHSLTRAMVETVEASKQKVAEVASKPSSRKLAKQLGVDTRIQNIVKPTQETLLQRIVNDVPGAIRSADVISLSIQTMQQKLTGVEFERVKPDLVIGVPMDACGMMEFERAKEMIELGREQAAKALNEVGW
jgi:NTE family protein